MIIDMKRHGFTVVELIIVITVMGILIVLGTVNLRNSTKKAYDSERKADIEAIAMNLETFYTSGTNGSSSIGFYPSTATLGTNAGNCTLATVQNILRDVNPKVLRTPGNNDNATSCDLIKATNNDQATDGVLPQPTLSTYVYQPLQSDGSQCDTAGLECRKFNLFYKIETTDTVYKLKSKNQ